MEKVFATSSTVLDIVEAVANYYKHALLSTRTFFYPLMLPFLSLIANTYKPLDHYPLLQALSVAVSIFGKWAQFEDELAKTFQHICNTSISAMQADFFVRPDMVKEFFSLCTQYVRYASQPLCNTNLLATLYMVSVTIIPLLPDKGVRFVLDFIGTVVGLGALRGISAAAAPGLVEQAEALMAAQGSFLVRLILAGIGGTISTDQASPSTAAPPAMAAGGGGPSVAVSRHLLRSFSELLYEFVQNYPNQFREWARAQLMQPGFPTSHVTQEQKTEFLANLMRSKQKPNFKNCIQQFAILARGLGDYGSRTNPL